jgi:Ca-activated chloride channel family protein
VATTSIDQVFKNDYDVDLEGTYMFPLPEEAAITDFSMYVDGKKVSGKILDKDKARQVYEDIVRQMKDPGLLEYVGRNMFKARVYPIPKRGEKRVQLVYKQTLKYDSGVYKYVYPLDTEKYSPKPLEEVTISAKIKSKAPIKSLYSPSHKLDTKIEDYSASCGYEARNVKPDKNFVLYYSVSEKDVGLNLLSYKKRGEDGYFMLLLSPGQLKGKTINKDIIFVLDTSGSMSGEKIKQAKEALRFCINKLDKRDRFNVIGFATDIDNYKDSLVPASRRNTKGALKFIDKLEARGGTNINDALLSSLKMFSDSRRPRMLVFLTDGEPTVGETDIKEIIENLDDANKAKARIFVFGVGSDVNSHLLDKMSEVHRGVSEYVEPHEDIEVNVSSFFRKISEPILSDINLNFGKIKTADLQPRIMPDIFRGTQLVLLGRYEGDGSTAITLTGYVNGKKKKFVYDAKFLKSDTENDFIPRLWATRKIGYLMSEIRLSGEKKELIDEIIKLSKEHGIMTPYTSFLILEKESDYRRWGFSESAAPMMKAAGSKYKADMESLSGMGAVSRAKDIITLKQSEVAEEPEMESVKHVGDKTFYRQNGMWVDAEYEEGAKTQKIKYLSNKYFDLLKKRPKIGKYLSIAENVIVVFEGKIYQIKEE